jgi:hypothetical protein
MAEILRLGKNEWPGRIIICRRCDSEVKYDQDDLIYNKASHDQRDGYPEYVTLKCPVCGKTQRVNSSEIPPRLWIELRKAAGVVTW